MMELSVTGDAADVWIVIRATTLDGIYLWARYDPGGVPCPGVVARTELLGVSPVSGEPMASEDVSGKGASHHRPTDLTAPATLPALHRNGTTEPRSTVSEASGPGAPSSPGPHPDRAGGGDNNPVHGADGHPWHVLGYEHTRPSTYSRNDSGAGAVTIEQADAPVAGGPAGRGVRASDLNGPGVLPAGAVRQARNSKSAWRPSAVTSAHRLCQVLYTPWRSNGGQEASPVWPLDPLLWRRAKHDHLVAQSRSRARPPAS